MNERLDVNAVVEDSRLGAFQVLVLLQCFLCMVVDGFDVQAMAYAAPALIQQWGIDKASLGPVFSCSLLGMLIGSLTFGSIADRLGRRPVLIGAAFSLSLLMYATRYATTVEQLVLLRLLTGLAMGAIVPNVAALASEYAPMRNRIMLLMLVSSGLVAGGIIGGAAAAALLPAHGWQVVFLVGAVAPLAVALLMLVALPESLQWCVLRGRHLQRVRKTLRRLRPGLVLQDSTVLAVAEPPSKGMAITHLFAPGHLAGTLLLWLINFMNMLCVYFLASWIPVLMSAAGHSASQSVLAGTSMWVGGLAGSWLLGWLVDKRGFGAVLVPTFLVSALAIIGFSRYFASIDIAYLCIAIAGFGILGGQAALNAMAALFYPTALRGTGAGWALGLGRLGGICGPFIGSGLLHLSWSTTDLLAASALPAAFTALGILAFWRLPRPRPAAVTNA